MTTDDVLGRLRDYVEHVPRPESMYVWRLCAEVADEVERLQASVEDAQAEIEQLRGQLQGLWNVCDGLAQRLIRIGSNEDVLVIYDTAMQMRDDVAVLENSDERLVNVHSADKCEGEHCTIHNMSDHHMRGWPQHWRSDRGIMERICPHGVGHPDPDSPWHNKDSRWIHGCDGCCIV